MLRPYIPFRGILSPIYALPPPITRKNDGIPAKSVTRPPRRDHSITKWKDRGIRASACTVGPSGCGVLTIHALVRTS